MVQFAPTGDLKQKFFFHAAAAMTAVTGAGCPL